MGEKDESAKKPTPDRIETGRVTTFDAEGKMTGETISYESGKQERKNRGKDNLDAIIKILGVLGIGIPVWLFFYAQQSEFKRQKSIMEYDAYSKLSIELHKYYDKIQYYTMANKKELEKSKDTLLFELIPRSSLFKNDSLKNYISEIKRSVGLIYYYFKFQECQDSVYYSSEDYFFDKRVFYSNLKSYDYIRDTYLSYMSFKVFDDSVLRLCKSSS
jgi:hypothetical protein